MIYKERTMPKKLIGQAALMRRLHPDHAKYQPLRESYRNSKAGFGGEQDFDKHMKEFKPHYPYAILHDICLKQEGIYFQMDSILITPAFIYIFEVKNFGGKILIKSKPTQFIRELPTGERKVMNSPIVELERKQFLLTNWLAERKIQLPVKTLVAFAFTNELMMEEELETKILFTNEVPNHLRTIPVENELINKDEIQRLAISLRNHHQEYDPFPMIETLSLSRDDMLPGVICPSCGFREMKWTQKKWQCPHCNYASTACHLDTLADWNCLVSKRITNSEFRNFACVESSHIAKRLLQGSGLSKKGERRGAHYVLEE
ncbi:nuclease-related domain-containing protein [Sporosarcina sp. 179-K 3D1 HS]|uniref:nuclease-related domain-containing protein n=1 Tax=Sporosarcina sp. 179-K 3D1 HS TaxID=3232169 RepID=UPI0039A064DF